MMTLKLYDKDNGEVFGSYTKDDRIYALSLWLEPHSSFGWRGSIVDFPHLRVMENTYPEIDFVVAVYKSSRGLVYIRGDGSRVYRDEILGLLDEPRIMELVNKTRQRAEDVEVSSVRRRSTRQTKSLAER